MSGNIVNQSPFLRTSREFPYDDAHQLSVEVNKMYISIASEVNIRTIGIYPQNRSAITGNTVFITPTKQQTLRQLYTFSSAGSISHNIKTSNIYGFLQIFGTFTDGTNWYPLPYVDVTDVTNQVSIEVTSSDIVITAGGGAPTISSGTIVLEWISQP